MDKLREITDKVRGMEIYESLVMAGIGLAVLFFGYRIKKIAFFVIWFLIGYNLTMLLLPVINGAVPQVAESPLYQILLPIGGGLLLALLGFSIEKLCVAGICFFLIMLITVQYFGTDIQTLAVGGILGAVAGAAGTAMLRPAIILATSIAGGWAITLALLNIFPEINSEVFYFPILIGLALIGAVFQLTTTKRLR